MEIENIFPRLAMFTLFNAPMLFQLPVFTTPAGDFLQTAVDDDFYCGNKAFVCFSMGIILIGSCQPTAELHI